MCSLTHTITTEADGEMRRAGWRVRLYTNPVSVATLSGETHKLWFAWKVNKASLVGISGHYVVWMAHTNTWYNRSVIIVSYNLYKYQQHDSFRNRESERSFLGTDETL